MNRCEMIREPRPMMIYVYVARNAKFAVSTAEFLASYKQFPPGVDHDTVIMVNNGDGSEASSALNGLPRCQFLWHDNSGQDIGAYIALSDRIQSDCALYIGGGTFFQRAGWFARMMEVWRKYGPGFYGTQSSYERSPHLCTTCFLCDPQEVAAYPFVIQSAQDRYHFEYGPNSLWRRISDSGKPAKLVTWDGEYDWPEWRTPPDIFRRGNQSNCVSFFKHSRHYAALSPTDKLNLEALTNTITDPEYITGRYAHERKNAK